MPERENPLFAPSTLSFGAPPFDQIRDTDYQPAIERGMREQLAEVAAIANQTDAPTFENTIVALERSGVLFTRVLKIFGTVAAANTNDTLQEAQRVLAPRLAAHTDAIYLDNALYQRVRELYERRENLGMTGEAKHLLERYH